MFPIYLVLGIGTLIFVSSRHSGQVKNENTCIEKGNSTHDFRVMEVETPAQLSHKKNISIGLSAAKEIYEGKVAVETLNRVGRNMNAKGIVHEELFKDKFNMNPKNVILRRKMVLSKSPTAIRDDILVYNIEKKIIKRWQLKDTPSSISKTYRQIISKKYIRTNCAGTIETVKNFKEYVADKNISQSLISTGISSSDTQRIADKALGKMTSINNLIHAAKSNFKFGAIASGGYELISSGINLLEGEITLKEFAGKVGSSSIVGGVTAATVTLVSSIVTGATSATVGTISVINLLPLSLGVLAGISAGMIVQNLFGNFISGYFVKNKTIKKLFYLPET